MSNGREQDRLAQQVFRLSEGHSCRTEELHRLSTQEAMAHSVDLRESAFTQEALDDERPEDMVTFSQPPHWVITPAGHDVSRCDVQRG